MYKSIFSDVAGTGEEERKGKTPKEERTCCSSLGHMIKSHMTVICTTCFGKAWVIIGWRTVRLEIDGALSRRYLSYIIRRRTFASAFFDIVIYLCIRYAHNVAYSWNGGKKYGSF